MRLTKAFFPTALVVIAACGGRTVLEGDLTQEQTDDGGSSSGIATGTSSGVISSSGVNTSSGVITSSSGGVSTSGTSSGVSTSSSSSGVSTTSTSSGATTSSSGTSSSSSSGVIDAGPPPPPPVTCGAEVCDPSQQCCLQAGAGGISETCVATGSCMGLAFSCTSAVNCAMGEVCCVGFGVTGPGATCEPMCTGLGLQLCQTPAECPAGDSCEGLAPGLSVCRRRAGFGGEDAGAFGGFGG